MPFEADILPDGLSADRAELWLMDPALATGPWLERQGALLAPDERRRAESFGSLEPRLDYVRARLMQRLVLSRLTGVDPATWRFAPASGGKPGIVEPRDQRRVRFNISHTRGLVALAVCRDAEVGVDVEALNPATDVVAVARRFFAAQEVAALMALEEVARAVRFLELWSLKEACLKAIGTGLASPLAAARFDIEPDGSFTATLDPELKQRGGRWSFASLRPTSEHVLALALLSPAPAAGSRVHLAVRPRWFSP